MTNTSRNWKISLKGKNGLISSTIVNNKLDFVLKHIDYVFCINMLKINYNVKDLYISVKAV